VKIVVCLKQVPDTEATIKIGADQKSVVEAGVKFIVNPYDEFAIEEALKIKEAAGAGSVFALSLGPERVKEALRTAISLGVDDALLLKSEQNDLDGLTVAKALADKIRALGFDLILLGKEAIDDGSMQVGPMIAEVLGIPCITVVTKLKLEGNKVIAEKEGEGGIEVLETNLPCIVTCQKGLNEPRYPSIRGVMMAKKKEIAVEPAQVEASKQSVQSLSYPPARSGSKMVGEGAAAVPALVTLLREEAKVI
jgi:electron transfer flavoprotein beta subunit